MPCTSYTSKEILGLAQRLARILMMNPNITEVRLTGSLARLEKHIHDIDLVVLHNGTLNTGTISLPRDCMDYCHDPGHTHIRLSHILNWYQRILFYPIRLFVPVQIILVDRWVLSSCSFLQRLKDYDSNPEFWKAIFKELDMLPVYSRNTNKKPRISDIYTDCYDWLGQGYSEKTVKSTFKKGLLIAHRCIDLKCKPTIPWPERRKERARKGIRKNCEHSYVVDVAL